MEVNYRNTRYNVNWDCSNQNKRYTRKENEFIKECCKNNISPVQIAQMLKRGLWAIEVQIMYIKNDIHNSMNNNDYSRTYTQEPSVQDQQYFCKQKKQKQYSTKQLKRVSRQTYKFQTVQNSNHNNNLKRFYDKNRKFKHAETEQIIQPSTTVIQNHLNELMGL